MRVAGIGSHGDHRRRIADQTFSIEPLDHLLLKGVLRHSSAVAHGRGRRIEGAILDPIERIGGRLVRGELLRRPGCLELLDEIASTRPEVDRTRYHSLEELKANGLQHLRETVELLERKATAEEVDDYRRFVLSLSQRVAEAHKEHGERVSEAETAALTEVAEALGPAAPQSGDQ